MRQIHLVEDQEKRRVGMILCGENACEDFGGYVLGSIESVRVPQSVVDPGPIRAHSHNRAAEPVRPAPKPIAHGLGKLRFSGA